MGGGIDEAWERYWGLCDEILGKETPLKEDEEEVSKKRGLGLERRKEVAAMEAAISGKFFPLLRRGRRGVLCYFWNGKATRQRVRVLGME